MKRKISALFLFIGALFRGHGLPSPAIWYDEAYSLELTRLGFFDLIRTQFLDFNPPLWEMVLFPFARISESVTMLRLPSLITSVVALWVFWLIMDELEFSDNQRLWASLLAGLLPGHFLIAQDARVYALLSLLYLLAILFAIRGQLLGLTAVSGLMLYSHGTAGVLAVSVYLLVWYMHPNKLRHIIISGLAAFGSWLPWLPSLLDASGEFWLNSLTSQYFFMSTLQAVWAESLPIFLKGPAFFLMLFYGLVGVVITLSVSLPVLYRVAAENIHQGRAATSLLGLEKVAARLSPPERPEPLPEDQPIPPLGIVTVIPLALMVLVSLVYANVVFYRPLTVFLLPFSLWLGASTAPVDVTWYKLILPAAVTLLIAVGVIGWDPAKKGGHLDLVAQEIAGKLSPCDAVFYATGTAALPIEYYIRSPHQTYIMDADQHDGLLQNDIQDAFGYRRALPEEVSPEFVVIPRDPIIEPEVADHIDAYVDQADVLRSTRINYWQAAPIDIYHLK